MTDQTEKRFRRLKRQATQYNNKLAELKGAEREMLSRLKEEFKCDSYEEGVELLQELEQQSNDHEKELNKLLDQFEEKWGDLLAED